MGLFFNQCLLRLKTTVTFLIRTVQVFFLMYHFLSIEELTFSTTSFPLRMSPKSLKEKLIISCIYLGMSNLSPSFSRFIYINLYVRYASAAISLMDSLIICSYCF